MTIKQILITILVFAFVSACTDEYGPEGCENAPRFLDQNIAAINIQPQFDTSIPINSGNTLLFTLEFEPETSASASFIQLPRISFSFFKQAHATTCIPPAYSEMISYINITSDADYDSSHLAGQSLNDIFYVDFGDNIASGTLYETPIGDWQTVLTFQPAPTLDKTHNFQFYIELDSGSTFTIDLDSLVFE